MIQMLFLFRWHRVVRKGRETPPPPPAQNLYPVLFCPSPQMRLEIRTIKWIDTSNGLAPPQESKTFHAHHKFFIIATYSGG